MSARLSSASALLGAVSFAASGAAFGACTGPGAPTNTQTKCIAAVQIPGKPLRSFDISFVNPHRAEFYFADRSNAAIQVIDTRTLTHKRALGGFVGVKLNAAGNVNNNISGPDGVVSHGRWLYAGDGNSDLRVYDLDEPTASAFKQKISTGGATRVDEMDITSDGEWLLVANNAEDPPFGTLFAANGDRNFSAVQKHLKINIDNAIVPAGEGLSIEQPAWEPRTGRFYVSLPQIANNPAGCTFDGSGGKPICQGGLLIVDPHNPKPVYGAFDAATNTGVLALSDCGPNGATVGPNANLMLGCTPQNVATNKTTQVINALTKNTANVVGLTGSDEVWYNAGDNRYYTGSSRACGKPSGCPTGGAVLGVIDGTSVLIEKIPQSSNSHSVAADSKRNRIFVPQVAPVATVGSGGDGTTVGAGICGSTNGCVAVYEHKVDRDRDDDDEHEHGDR
jgi:hypothetical protein